MKRTPQQVPSSSLESIYQTIFDQSPISTQIFSPSGELIKVNKTWESLWEVTLKKIGRYNILQDQQLISLGIMELIKKAFRGQTVIIPPVRYVPDQTIEGITKVPYRYTQGIIYPIKNTEGRVVNVILHHEDITQQIDAQNALKKSKEQQTFLAQTSKILSSSLDYHKTLKKIADLSVPELADWCIIYIKEITGDVKRLAVSYANPSYAPIAAQIQSQTSIDVKANQGVSSVIQSGKAVLYDKPTKSLMVSDVGEKNRLKSIIKELNVTSWMCVPLTYAKKTFGAISFISTTENRHYTDLDLRFVTELGRHAAIAIENARLYKEAQDEIVVRKKAEEALRQSEKRFRTLIEQSTDAIQLVSPEGKILYTSESIRNVLGYSPEEIHGRGVGPYMHPEDLPNFLEKFQYLLDHPEKQITLQYRVRHKDGSWAWIETTGVNHLATSHVKALVGTFRNITKRKKYEEELRYQKTLLEAQREVAPEGVLVVSPEGKMVSYNNRFVQMWKFSKSLMENGQDELALQEATLQLVNPDRFMKRVQEIYKSQKSSFDEILFTDGRVFDRYGSPVLGEDGTDYGYVWFFQDVTERKRLEKQKDEFLGIASHELKTPITSLKAYEQVLQNRFAKQGDEKAVMMLGKMDSQINKLTYLIQDLLDISKIEAGRLQFYEHEYSIDDVIREVREEVQRTTDKQTLLLNGDSGKIIKGDRGRVGQVITNFLTNAIKYSLFPGKIVIHTYVLGKEVIVCVEDFGVGIPQEDIPHVFERFFRVRGDAHDTVPGMGLGLFISSEIIKRQKGRIWVESVVGKGSKFCFALPFYKSAAKKAFENGVQKVKQQ